MNTILNTIHSAILQNTLLLVQSSSQRRTAISNLRTSQYNARKRSSRTLLLSPSWRVLIHKPIRRSVKQLSRHRSCIRVPIVPACCTNVNRIIDFWISRKVTWKRTLVTISQTQHVVLCAGVTVIVAQHVLSFCCLLRVIFIDFKDMWKLCVSFHLALLFSSGVVPLYHVEAGFCGEQTVEKSIVLFTYVLSTDFALGSRGLKQQLLWVFASSAWR